LHFLHQNPQKTTKQEEMAIQQLSHTVVRGNEGHDANTETLITISSGMKRTGGYRVEIDKVEYDTDSKVIHVYAKDVAPGLRAMVTQAFTHPKVTIKVPKGDSQSNQIHWVGGGGPKLNDEL
jgi:hypothetical protein